MSDLNHGAIIGYLENGGLQNAGLVDIDLNVTNR